MEKQPDFLKKFTKTESPDERQALAQKIREERSEFFKNKRKKQEELLDIESELSEKELTLKDALQRCENLENELEELSSDGYLKKIRNYFHIKSLEAKLAEEKDSHQTAVLERDGYNSKQEEISKEMGSKEIPEEFQNAKEMVDNFYKEQGSKWAQSEYSPEDMQEYFSEEHLSSLSLKDYTLLLKRFPMHMVTHVTRQGVRDHVGHMYHAGGVGEYTDGFMQIVEDGRMRSPLGIHLAEEEKEKAIAKFLGLEDFKDKDSALAALEIKTDSSRQREPGSYADNAAIHFATDYVANAYYGSESGNEIFFTYPSALIASQYYFSGKLNSNEGGTNWNDQWVWANEEKGMDINAGLAFIPKETRVDRKTGSRYELDDNMNPSKNMDHIEKIRSLVEASDFQKLSEKIHNLTGNIRGDKTDWDFQENNKEILTELEIVKEKLASEFSISDPRLVDSLLNFRHINNLRIAREGVDSSTESSVSELRKEELISYIEKTLQDDGILYNEASDTVSSEEFWESFFEKNPDKKPSKIIYYEGEDPTEALSAWQRKNSISKKSNQKDLGVAKSEVERGSAESTAGMDRFKSLAKSVINNHFDK